MFLFLIYRALLYLRFGIRAPTLTTCSHFWLRLCCDALCTCVFVAERVHCADVGRPEWFRGLRAFARRGRRRHRGQGQCACHHAPLIFCVACVRMCMHCDITRHFAKWSVLVYKHAVSTSWYVFDCLYSHRRARLRWFMRMPPTRQPLPHC